MNLLQTIKAQAPAMRDHALGLLKALAGCDTTDYHEKNGQERLEEYLTSLNCQVSRVYPDPQRLRKYPQFNAGHTYDDRYCLAARFAGTGGGRSLILNAHMDTVFPASPEKWLTDPFTPVEKEGRVYGLGAADDKGGMTAMLTALTLLQRLGVRLKGDVIFESVVDEEAGGGNGSLAMIDAGFVADAVLVAEPNQLKPCSAQTGSCALKLTVEGRSAHGNMKYLGVSAFEKALPLINRLTELEKAWNRRTFPLFQNPVLTILRIQAGDGSITLPAACDMLVNFTYLPDGYDYMGELRQVIDDCQKQDPWFIEHPIRVALHHDCGPYYTDPDSPWPAAVARCVQEMTGGQAEVGALPTGADSRLFATVGSMPCVVLGPGSILDCHNPNEYLDIDEMMRAVQVYAAILVTWCGV